MDDEAWGAQYEKALPIMRAHCLRSYIDQGMTEEARRIRREIADGWAELAGFSEKEIRELLHLRDGQAPAGGWRRD